MAVKRNKSILVSEGRRSSVESSMGETIKQTLSSLPSNPLQNHPKASLKKTVRFRRMCQVRELEHNTGEENFNAWFQSEDYKAFKMNTLKCLKSVLKKHDHEIFFQQMDSSAGSGFDISARHFLESSLLEQGNSWSGLEHYLPSRAGMRERRRSFLWETIVYKNSNDSGEEDWREELCVRIRLKSAKEAFETAIIIQEQLGFMGPNALAKASKSVLKSHSRSQLQAKIENLLELSRKPIASQARRPFFAQCLSK